MDQQRFLTSEIESCEYLKTGRKRNRNVKQQSQRKENEAAYNDSGQFLNAHFKRRLPQMCCF
jgi:hypothetical protein